MRRRDEHWIIDTIAPDFRLLDVWPLPVTGTAEEFPAFLDTMASVDPTRSDSRVSRALFAIRFEIGRRLGWDDASRRRSIPGCTETTLADRLPANLRGSATQPVPVVATTYGFVPLYLTDREWAAELSNATVHGVLHLAWAAQNDGRYRAQLGVYVKTRGLFGAVYMKAIEPFRHLVVYPALVRQIERAWTSGQRGATSASPSR